MFGLTKKRDGSDDIAPRNLSEVVARLRVLENALDDLHDQFRRFRARTIKRMSVDETEETAQAAKGVGGGRSLPTPAQLRASGRWPMR